MRVLRSDDRGFSLVEMLVVMVIIGILAMIALPAFVGQRLRGEDMLAQSTVRAAAGAIHAYEVEHDTFDATRAELEAIEPTLKEATAEFRVTGSRRAYAIEETSQSRTTFRLERDGSGAIARTCSAGSRGLCRSGNRW